MFFSISRDIFVAVVYISPEYSSHNNNDIESIYSILLGEVEKYNSLGDIIIQGDFNAYTNTQLDFIEFDNVTEHVNLDDSEYHPDRTLSRNNLDHKHTNNSGKLLLNMCNETKIRILNGRTTGDLNGQPTCITYNGSSLVDYTLTSEELIDSIGYFVVHDFTSLSNHRPISCAMFANFSSVPCDLHKLDSLPGKFLWTDEAIASYTENMQSQMFKDKFANFIAKSFNDSDSITESFNSILEDCAKQSAKFINKKPIQKLRKSTRKPWSEHTLVSKIFLATEKNNPWTKKLYSILNNLGFSNLAGGNFSIKQYLPSIKQRVIDQCTQDQSSKIYNSSKQKFYQQFHNSNQRSSYVDVLSNKLERSSLCKIRLSAHNLAIEKGRHLGLPTNEQVCNVCKSGEVEDESHFLLNCEKFSNYRINFKTIILNILPTSCSESQLNMKCCINSNSLKVLKVTSSYIHKCLVYRNEILASF
ncbi:unnamed protein product [Mytilus coruscus]|uniref:Endonuclease/exonuclease/phosphatase domain-containing protein n=1 Tax=Mytilus coruscus TaxID=42192 RepID=A0A6J8CKG5_MYTCO|nr:unnamed protein product [Mytilus coruscus]